MKSNLPESPKGQTLRRRIDTIIGLLFLTVLVGSLVVVVNLMHHGTNHAASAPSRLVPTLSVYVGNGTGGLDKLDANTGRLMWTFQTQGKEVPAPALIANNTAYFGSTDGNLYAVNATTGKEEWHFSTGQTILGSPILANGVLYFGSDDSNLYAINPSSGAKLWSQYAGIGGEAVSVGTPAVVNGVVYATSTNNSTHSYVLAVKAQNGAQIWRQTANSELLSSPQVSDNKVYVAAIAITKPGQSSTRESHLEVFSVTDGSHAVQSVPTQFATPNTQTISPPTLGNGDVFIGSLSGSVSATGVNGIALWQKSLGGEVDAPPQLANGSLFVGVNVGTITGNSIVALNAVNGALRWQRFINNYAGSNIAVNNNTVFFGAEDGKVYALDASTGVIKWKVQDSPNFSNQPLSVGP
jgi:eukaryotic-like serine/threonine-protein kinase